MRFETLAKICEALECKPADLLDIEEGAALADGGDIELRANRTPASIRYITPSAVTIQRVSGRAESGTPVSDVCRQIGVSEATFYQ